MKAGQPRRPLAGSHRRPGCSGSSSGARCRPPSRARRSDPSGWPSLQPPPEQPRSPSALPGQPAGRHGAIAPRPLGERRAWVAGVGGGRSPLTRAHRPLPLATAFLRRRREAGWEPLRPPRSLLRLSAARGERPFTTARLRCRLGRRLLLRGRPRSGELRDPPYTYTYI